MDKKESVGPEQSTPVEAEIELYEALQSTGLDDRQALRTAHAVRVQAGHNIKETLEIHRRGVDTRIDGVETGLNAKIDGVETRLNAKIDRVEAHLNAKIDSVEARLNAKIDRVEARLNAKIDGVETNLNAKIDSVHAELKSMRRELDFYRRGFNVLFTLLALIIALLTLIIAAGLVPKFERWFWEDSTPAQSVQAPVESDPPETAVPPESDPPEPSPQ